MNTTGGYIVRTGKLSDMQDFTLICHMGFSFLILCLTEHSALQSVAPAPSRGQWCV